ncbi:Protein SSUH2-like [Holothuria leucospilota]|uniref:Protein SSUH2-like n=1 Tax=Holothuria leucospilota TaxID=206669 RepID=A0A9Q1BZI3_HOLLE|nr:Protein SSUH2-like [Holothuria leucospilota]
MDVQLIWQGFPESQSRVNYLAFPGTWQANPTREKPTYDGSDVSDTDPEDNENSVPSYDQPPDISNFGAPPGYEQVGTNAGEGAPLKPPLNPLYQHEYGDQRPTEKFRGVSSVEDEKVREAICTFANKKCCYGTGAAEKMSFTNIAAAGALHYQLETFTEERRTCWKHEPYYGGYVDGQNNGQTPAVWDIVCEPNAMFETHTKRSEVPHSSEVKECHGCHGRGYRRCHRCHGRGRVRCSSCHGSGRRRVYEDGHNHYESCGWCGGDGRKRSSSSVDRCTSCGGDGRVTCHTCDGYCRLRWYIQLTVQFTNNLEDYIHETTDMPDELIRDVSGEVVFEQTLPFVWPITQYHVADINTNSTRIVEKHRNAWPNAKLLQQRQVLRSVPVTEVKYLFKEKEGRFWVYGYEYEVHCPDYPHNCCWGCVII